MEIFSLFRGVVSDPKRLCPEPWSQGHLHFLFRENERLHFHFLFPAFVPNHLPLSFKLGLGIIELLLGFYVPIMACRSFHTINLYTDGSFFGIVRATGNE